MLSSSVTVKGQVTIPAELRTKLGIQPGDRVGFVEQDGCILLQRQEHRIESVFGLIKPAKGATPEDIDAAVAAGWGRRAGA